MKLLEKRGAEWVLSDLAETPGLLSLAHTDDIAHEAPNLAGVAVIRLDWPAFKFGQGFTQARLLRERYGFTGQIRAGGALFRDQAWHAARCGVDAFEIDEADADGWRESLSAYHQHYQLAVTGQAAWRLRAEGAA